MALPPDISTRGTIPNEIVSYERALVSLNSSSAEVQIKTVTQRISRIPPDPPQVTTSCESVSTWAFSANHQTQANGTVEIKLNKFLECIPTAIQGTTYSNYIGSMPHFAATPETEEAVFLTYKLDIKAIPPLPGQTFLPQPALEVTVTVKSWKHDGNPAPNVSFSWIAITRITKQTNL